MKTTLQILIFFWIFSATAQTTHNQDWERNIGSNVDLTIVQGDTVIWTWIDGSHTVENDPAGSSVETFNSGFLGPAGSTFSHTFTALGSNDYYCGIHGAASMSGTITVSENLSIDNETIKNFKISPNPANQILNISLPQTLLKGQITIHDLLGKKVHTRFLNGGNIIILDVSLLKSGIYLISVESENLRQTKRFVKI